MGYPSRSVSSASHWAERLPRPLLIPAAMRRCRPSTQSCFTTTQITAYLCEFDHDVMMLYRHISCQFYIESTQEVGMEAATQSAAGARLNTVEDVMERLRIGRSTAFELISTRQLRSIKVGRRRLVSEAALVEFIEGLDRQNAD